MRFYERFIARQPIFDRRLKVFAYQLLFRGGPQNIGYQDPVTKNFRVFDEPSFENCEDEEGWADHVVAHDRRIRVTEKGRQFLLEELQREYEKRSIAKAPCESPRLPGRLASLHDAR